MKKGICILIAAFLLLWGTNLFAAGNESGPLKSLKVPKVAWFSTLPENHEQTGEGSPFWKLVDKFMKATAQDLGIELTVQRCNDNRVKMMRQVKMLLENTATRPDAIIIHNYMKRGELVLAMAQQYGVKAFLFNAGFGVGSTVGAPREKYANWIGQMLPDDEAAGRVLAEELLERAKALGKTDDEGNVQCVGIGGNQASQASVLRLRGYRQAYARNPELKSVKVLNAEWRKERVMDMFEPLHMHFPDVAMFWVASDLMAEGVIDAAKARGLVPGKDFVTGGFDWLPEALESIKKGDMAASLGGHYTEGAFALVLIYDYLQGVDFADIGPTTYKTSMMAITGENIGTFGGLAEKLTLDNISKIDFRELSRVYNPGLEKYNFDVEALLGRL